MATDLKNPTLPTIVVTGGSQDGDHFAIEQMPGMAVLGSGGDAHLRLHDAPNVATEHARVTWDVRGVTVVDLFSPAGTYINGERLREERPLRDGDRISLGPPGVKGSAKLLVRVPAFVGTLQGLPGMSPEAAMDLGSTASRADGSSEPMVLDLAEVASDALELDLGAPTGTLPEPPPTGAIEAPPPTSALQLPAFTPPEPVEDAAADEAAPAPAKKPKAEGKEPRLLPKRDWMALLRPIGALAGVVVAIGLAALVGQRLLKRSPVASSIMPPAVEAGQTATIHGAHLDASPAGNSVTIAGARAEVTAATAERLTVKLPAGLKPGPAPVVVESKGKRAGALTITIVLKTKVESLDPSVAMPGDEITIRGKAFDAAKIAVTVAGMAATVVNADEEAVRVKVPPEITPTLGKQVPVVVRSGAWSSPPQQMTLGHLPLVTAMEPKGGAAGTRVRVKGMGFDTDAALNVVSFGGQRALVLKAAANELVVSAPSVATKDDGAVEVVVQAKNGKSVPLSFALLRPSMSTFEPAFYAAPAPSEAGEGRVLVSTDLGPFLLLSSKADAPTTAERAVRVAAALNDFVAASRQAPIALDVKDGDPPGVAAAGRPPFLTATSEDAAGYAGAWSGVRAAPAPRSLARHWAALIQDYVALFVRHERPLKALEVTPRAKVLLELFDESTRRGGSGVPMSLFSPPSPALAKSLRDLSLQVAAGGGAVTAAIAGEWAGSMQDNAGPRQIRVRFENEGGRLGGSFASSLGSVSIENPLQSVSFGGGAVRFAVQIRGSLKRFSGTLAGDTITGAVQSGDGAGTFTLKLSR